jgi:hypothetical protein
MIFHVCEVFRDFRYVSIFILAANIPIYYKLHYTVKWLQMNTVCATEYISHTVHLLYDKTRMGARFKFQGDERLGIFALA